MHNEISFLSSVFFNQSLKPNKRYLSINHQSIYFDLTSTMSVPKSRIMKLAALSAKIFDENFNPTAVRTGGKILSQRLKGPSIVNYYGNPDFLKFKHLKTLYPGFNFADQGEDYRLCLLYTSRCV